MALRFLCIVLLCMWSGGSAFAQATNTQPVGKSEQSRPTQEFERRLAMIEKWQPVTPPATTDYELLSLLVPPEDPPASGADSSASAPPAEDKERPRLDIYGYAMLDMGYDVNQNDPNWFDVMRPTKLPASPDQFGRDGNFYSGVRQSRLGVKGYFQTPLGELKTIFEFELFGVGVDAGQTTFRLRHAWGELGQFGAGQTWSPFMDPDVFPNSLEYWGPNGMVFFRNVQARWMPVNKGNHQLWFALERPGASGDLGVVANRIELQNIQARFPAPDLSARFRWGGQRGYLQISGIGRYIAWDDLKPTPPFDFSGHTWGWGVNASSNLPMGEKNVLKLAVVYGHGIENYMNDAPIDVAPIATPANLTRPIDGEPLPVLSLVAFYDIYWSEKWSSSLGYSILRLDNSPLQLPSDFHRGQYSLFNLLHYPVKSVMIGGEFQWGHRNNFADGFEVDDYRIQFGFKYSFNFQLGGEK
jgi:DcaP outer membrane protein